MDEVVNGVVKFFGMSVCDNSDKINVAERSHTVVIRGMFMAMEVVLITVI